MQYIDPILLKKDWSDFVERAKQVNVSDEKLGKS